MSFPTAVGIMMPHELDVVRKVYSDIAAEDWFTRSSERREQFAATVIDLYRGGVNDPQDLDRRCRSLALESFGNGGIER